MAKRKVQRRARKILGEDPVALVWCEIGKPIPVPPKAVHRAAGKGRLKPGHPWLLYVGGVVFFFIVVPMMLVDKLGDVLGGQPASGEETPPAAPPQAAALPTTRPAPSSTVTGT